jgi:hypothetical protein
MATGITIMPEYFQEIIFPPLPKPEVKIAPQNTNLIASNMFERIYCHPKLGWYSFVECVHCNCKTKSLEEILESKVGCI